MVAMVRPGGTPLPQCRGNSVGAGAPRRSERRFGARLGPGTRLARPMGMATIRILALLVLLVSAGCGAAATSGQSDLAASPREPSSPAVATEPPDEGVMTP